MQKCTAASSLSSVAGGPKGISIAASAEVPSLRSVLSAFARELPLVAGAARYWEAPQHVGPSRQPLSSNSILQVKLLFMAVLCASSLLRCQVYRVVKEFLAAC